jgi:hypothetical protein
MSTLLSALAVPFEIEWKSIDLDLDLSCKIWQTLARLGRALSSTLFIPAVMTGEVPDKPTSNTMKAVKCSVI